MSKILTIIIVMFGITCLPQIIHGAAPIPVALSTPTNKTVRQVALIAINPSDNKPYILLFQPSAAYANWQIFSCGIDISATDLLASETNNYYGTDKVNSIISSVNAHDGNIFNIVQGQYVSREVILTHMQPNLREKLCAFICSPPSQKNFCWVPALPLLTLKNQQAETAPNQYVTLRRQLYILMKLEWYILNKALESIMQSTRTAITSAVPTNTLPTQSIAVRNNLESPIKSITLYSRSHIIGSIGQLDIDGKTLLKALDCGLPPYGVVLKIGNNQYCYLLQRPIASITTIIIDPNINTGHPDLEILNSSIKQHGGQDVVAQAIIPAYNASATAETEPDMKIILYNPNMNIRRVSLRGHNKVICLSICKDPQKSIWPIPAYRNNGEHTLSVESDNLVFTWLLSCITPGIDLLLFKQKPTLATLRIFKEGIENPQFSQLPLFSVIPTTKNI